MTENQKTESVLGDTKTAETITEPSHLTLYQVAVRLWGLNEPSEPVSDRMVLEQIRLACERGDLTPTGICKRGVELIPKPAWAHYYLYIEEDGLASRAEDTDEATRSGDLLGWHDLRFSSDQVANLLAKIGPAGPSLDSLLIAAKAETPRLTQKAAEKIAKKKDHRRADVRKRFPILFGPLKPGPTGPRESRQLPDQ